MPPDAVPAYRPLAVQARSGRHDELDLGEGADDLPSQSAPRPAWRCRVDHDHEAGVREQLGRVGEDAMRDLLVALAEPGSGEGEGTQRRPLEDRNRHPVDRQPFGHDRG